MTLHLPYAHDCDHPGFRQGRGDNGSSQDSEYLLRFLFHIHEHLRSLDERFHAMADDLATILAAEQAEGGEITQLVNAFNAQTQTLTSVEAELAALQAAGADTSVIQSILDAQAANTAELQAAIPVIASPPAGIPAQDPATTSPSDTGDAGTGATGDSSAPTS